MWQAYTQVAKMCLTNLHIDLDYKSLMSELLGSQECAYDNYAIQFT